jgi:cyclohexa-1,5-dienecarbonyl-CoA hydratase
MDDWKKIRALPLLDGQGLHIVLNAPKGNVLDGEMMAEVNALLESLGERHELKLLCFSGAGDHFSFGASVADHVGEKAGPMLQAFHGMFKRLVQLAIPTAAAVRGRCLGGGMELCCFCNRVFAHPSAVLGQPEIQLGVLAPIASLILPHRCGQPVADELLLGGRSVPAAEARELRLVDELADDPLVAVERWASRELLPKSASSLRFAVRAARWELHQTLSESLSAIEQLYLRDLMSTRDANEGLASFLEKRPPSWTNR